MIIFPIFIGVFSMYAISFIMQLHSVIIVSCVLVTKERKYKNVAHVAWTTAAITLFFGIIVTCFLTMTVLLNRDSCLVMEYSKEKGTTRDIPMLYPPEISPLLDTCLFEADKNAAINLNFGPAAQALENMQLAGHDYKLAQTESTNDVAAYTKWVADIEERGKTKPTSFLFSVKNITDSDPATVDRPQNPEIVQPEKQLRKVNNRTNSELSDLLEVCNSSQDDIVEALSECVPGVATITTEVSTNIYKDVESCIVITDLNNPAWYSDRYYRDNERNEACVQASNLIAHFLNFYNTLWDQSPSQLGVLN